jgi:hypothetical protein
VIINHFRSEKNWVATLTDALDPVTRRLGWRTTLRLKDVMQSQPLEVHRIYKSSPRSLFTVVQASKLAASGNHNGHNGAGAVAHVRGGVRRTLDPAGGIQYQEGSSRAARGDA